MSTIQLPAIRTNRRPWDKGRLVGQKRPLLAKQVWAIRARLELSGNLRNLALFNLAIDSKLRGCDLVRLTITDLVAGDRVRERVTVIQSKTKRPVQFEVSEHTREPIWNWVCCPEMLGYAILFPSRFHDRPHVSTRQYARLVRDWVSAVGLDPSGYGTYSLRRTKAALIYRKTGNLRAVQLLLGHTKVDSTVRYLGVELEDAIIIAEELMCWRGVNKQRKFGSRWIRHGDWVKQSTTLGPVPELVLNARDAMVSDDLVNLKPSGSCVFNLVVESLFSG